MAARTDTIGGLGMPGRAAAAASAGGRPAGLSPADEKLGDRLFEVVEHYADLGEHRTGTAADHATSEWFADALADLGAHVERRPYELDRWTASWSLTADGEPVDAFPLWCTAPGAVTTRTPHVAVVDVPRNVAPVGLDLELERARDRGAAVLVTRAGVDAVYAVNRPAVPTDQPPTLLVKPGDEATLTGDLRFELASTVTPGRSTNVVAALGHGDAAPVVIATPLSGWFSCASERGTGIAIALDLAAELAADRPVLVVGTTGHELHHLGLERLLATTAQPEPAAIVHVGASVAAGARSPAGDLVLAPTRLAYVAGARPSTVAPFLEAAAITLLDAGAAWAGEGQRWRDLGAPVLSFTGSFDAFHTRLDTPAGTTSPSLLVRARRAVGAAVDAFLAAT